MPKQPEFDVVAAHKYFAAQCFNKAWELIDKTERLPAEDRLMESLSQASLYHWLQREDCTNQHLSVGYWQASRIQSILGNAAEALRLANICLEYSADLEPFFLGYAHEALARAEHLVGNTEAAAEHLAQALSLASQVCDKDDRTLLSADLEQLTTAS